VTAPVGTPARSAQLLRKYGIAARKSLGQNFLIDGNILRIVADAAELGPEDGVLEIGPGLGALTERLAERAGRVVAVEIDRRLLPVLEEALAPYPNVEIVHGDVLKLDLRALIRERFAGARRVAVAANLPYYITTPILMKLLEERLPLSVIVVMVQREVADRLKAAPGGKDYGSLSVAAQYFTEPEWIAAVPRTVFLPPPNVESAVLRLRVRGRPAVETSDEPLFFEIVRAAFAQRRKTLLNNLQRLPAAQPLGKDGVRRWIEAAGVSPDRRGETLTLPEFAALADALAARRR